MIIWFFLKAGQKSGNTIYKVTSFNWFSFYFFESLKAWKSIVIFIKLVITNCTMWYSTPKTQYIALHSKNCLYKYQIKLYSSHNTNL